MPLQLHCATVDQKSILENLLHLYLHEMSKFEDLEISDEGRFVYKHLDSYFSDNSRFALLVYVKKKLAGFVLVRKLDTVAKGDVYTIAEIFILESYRRLGIGEEVSRAVFDRYQGMWQIPVLAENVTAYAFWKAVAYRYTGNRYREATTPGWFGPIFEFKSPCLRPEHGKATAQAAIPFVRCPQEKTV